MSFRCRPWSFAVRPLPRPGHHRPQRRMAGRDPDQERAGRPQRRLVVRPMPASPRNGDGSNSQFALLALYEAARVAETGQIKRTIHRETWELIHNYWIYNQRDGTAPGPTISRGTARAA